MGDEEEYRILGRKSKAHFHTSATCYSMIRSIKPFNRIQRSRHTATDFVTGRSQARDSNMHENEGEDVVSTSTISVESDMETGPQSGTEANQEPDM